MPYIEDVEIVRNSKLAIKAQGFVYQKKELLTLMTVDGARGLKKKGI